MPRLLSVHHSHSLQAWGPSGSWADVQNGRNHLKLYSRILSGRTSWTPVNRLRRSPILYLIGLNCLNSLKTNEFSRDEIIYLSQMCGNVWFWRWSASTSWSTIPFSRDEQVYLTPFCRNTVLTANICDIKNQPQHAILFLLSRRTDSKLAVLLWCLM